MARRLQVGSREINIQTPKQARVSPEQNPTHNLTAREPLAHFNADRKTSVGNPQIGKLYKGVFDARSNSLVHAKNATAKFRYSTGSAGKASRTLQNFRQDSFDLTLKASTELLNIDESEMQSQPFQEQRFLLMKLLEEADNQLLDRRSTVLSQKQNLLTPKPKKLTGHRLAYKMNRPKPMNLKADWRALNKQFTEEGEDHLKDIMRTTANQAFHNRLKDKLCPPSIQHSKKGRSKGATRHMQLPPLNSTISSFNDNNDSIAGTSIL